MGRRDVRGLAYISGLDIQRREKKLQKERDEKYRKELEGFAFKPKINAYPGIDSGRLQLLADPDNVLERVHRMREQNDLRIEKCLELRRKEEDKDCTFQPQVRPAPNFVCRMAESYRMVRAWKETSLRE